MRRPKLLFLVICLIGGKASGQVTTFCNPLNLNYRFSNNPQASYREAADPVIQLFKGTYYLYASKSGGYWYGPDLVHWTYRPSTSLPVDDYAPTVEAIHDTVFFIASSGTPKIYYNTDPKEDNWKVYNDHFPIGMTDPDLFRDEDGRVYFYYGCSDVNPIMGVELDTSHNLNPIGTPVPLIAHMFADHGWEEPGENNTNGHAGWNEGSWMNKHDGKYYLQFAAPGTEFKVYGDGAYVSDKPMGPFQYMPSSPFSYKPGGFIDGAGHGCTFKDKYGNYWHIATMSISVRHMFERRLGLFPAFFDEKGNLQCLTAFGDYPMIMPDRKMDFSKEGLFNGWMLLSYCKPIKASSAMEGHAPALANDEDVRTWWSASDGNTGQWLEVDLGAEDTVRALQVNFADEGAKLKAGMPVDPYQYKISGSGDGVHWHTLVDKSINHLDAPHDYILLAEPHKLRFIRLTIIQVPDGKFSVSDFRVFGKGTGPKPVQMTYLKVLRDSADSRRAKLNWDEVKGATGYVVHFGLEKNNCYHSIMVYGKHSLQLNALNKGVPYFFRVDAFNENGITKGIEK